MKFSFRMKWKNRIVLLPAFAALLAIATPSAFAEHHETKSKGPAPSGLERTEREEAARIAGKSLTYKVSAGFTQLLDEEDKPRAEMFSTDYFVETDDPSKRPVTFIFNGGPGSASLWLHMGVYGPRRVVIPSNAINPGSAPYEFADNDASILNVSDLVFIDPVGTGFSRAVGETKAKAFYGVTADADSVADFIRMWLTKNKRWNSPKYISGESYGTTRAAAVARSLTGGYRGIAINGVVLVSSILDFSTARFQPGHPTSYVAFLPTYAATAWYHKKSGHQDKSLKEVVAEARRFAVDEYLPALMKGATLKGEEEANLVKQLAALTGLSPEYIRQTRHRVGPFRFMKELARDEGFSVGRLDSRYKGIDFDGAGERFDGDPSGQAIESAYAAAVNHYLTGELGVPVMREYKVLTGEPGQNWDWNVGGRRGWPAYLNVAPWLSKAMRENPDMRTLVLNGYYDLATPFFGTELTFNNNNFPLDRVEMDYYEAGHMMYVHEPSLNAVGERVRNFLTK
ncbi:MAG: peptidase S10 [Pseudomonadota bacterium]